MLEAWASPKDKILAKAAILAANCKLQGLQGLEAEDLTHQPGRGPGEFEAEQVFKRFAHSARPSLDD